MKTRTIAKTINAKVEKWLASLPEQISRTVRPDVIVTGGCITSFLLQEDVNDYDIYLAGEGSRNLLATYYAETTNRKIYYELGGRIRVSGESVPAQNEDGFAEKPESEAPQFKVAFYTDNAISLTGKVQIVTRFFGPPEEIHKNYDFVHCTNYWTPGKGLVTNAAALESILTKELRYQGSLYPLCSLLRVRKFVQRKWTIHAGHMLKMVLQLQEFDLSDPKVLRDQLIGVDTLYFVALLSRIQDEGGVRGVLTWIDELIDKS